MFELIIPRNSVEETISIQKSLVIIGPNGSGKTRLGNYIERKNASRTHRISAQKSLKMPEKSTTTDLNIAKLDLFYGHTTNHSKHFRWNGEYEVGALNDYEKLMIYLYSERAEISSEYLRVSSETSERVTPPKTQLDIIKMVWEKVLPHRELIIHGLSIETRVRGSDKKYEASKMSDGERVAFYLIGQCLSAPSAGTIVIDEPEIHLNKAIQNHLWNEIEKLRPDCLFVYLTHDVDFAASMSDATKLWLKSYDGSNWDWELIETDDELPENLLLQIMGSRQAIVFVEGNHGSHDYSLYSLLLKNFFVIPVGSCHQVIQSVKSFKNNKHLHRYNIFGIIDRDRRNEEELQTLIANGIYALEVAEVENLFCTEEILRLICEKNYKNSDEIFTNSSAHIWQQFTGELENQISLRTIADIQFKLNSLDGRFKGKEVIKNGLDALIQSIDANAIFETNQKVLVDVQTSKNYKELLKVYNRKSLTDQVAKFFGWQNKEIQEFVIGMCKTEEVKKVRTLLKPYFGLFKNYIED